MSGYPTNQVRPWITATLLGTWTGIAAYRLSADGAHVEFAGAISGGVANSAAFQTPYVPKTQKEPDQGGNIVVWDTSGNFKPAGAIFLDGITLPIDI